MEVDAESILKLMFPDGNYPDAWKSNVDVSEFLCELGSFSQNELEKYERRLTVEAQTNLERTRELAFHNYGTFIETADCARDVAKDFGSVENNLRSVIEGCPQFERRCGEFEQKAQALVGHRRQTSLALARHTQLLEILELPQLMDTCVRNGYCEEALQLANYVQRLEKKHGKIPIIQDIVGNVQESQRLLVKQLLAQIGSPTQLPQCLKLLGYLRRLEVFSPAQLRVKFLQARTAWLNSAVDGVLKDDPYYHFNKVIELYRVHLFDIITQYRALFSSPVSATSSSLLSASSHKEDEGVDLTSIFHGWVLHVVQQFLATVEAGLVSDQKVVSRMDSLLGQCTYFAASLSRVGVDFTPQIHALFTKTALHHFKDALESADGQFRSRLQSISPSLLPNLRYSDSGPNKARTKDDLHPPLALLDFPPLAHLMNDWLRALNDLSACVQINSAQIVTHALDKDSKKTAGILTAFLRREKDARPSVAGDGVEACANLFVKCFIPHVSVCLKAMFPRDKLAQKVGLSLDKLESFDYLGCSLHAADVCQPLDEFLPKTAPVQVKPSPKVSPRASPVPQITENDKLVETGEVEGVTEVNELNGDVGDEAEDVPTI